MSSISMARALYTSTPFVPNNAAGIYQGLPNGVWTPNVSAPIFMPHAQTYTMPSKQPQSARRDDFTSKTLAAPPTKRQHNPYAAVAVDQTISDNSMGNTASSLSSSSVPLSPMWQTSPSTPPTPTPLLPLQRSGSGRQGFNPATAIVTAEEVQAMAGQLVELARTANGSSFVQAALREGCDPANLAIIWGELQPHCTDLLLDAHGCYVVKSVMERLPAAELQRVVESISCDVQLVYSMCTHSLHTRRVVQFLLDTVDCGFVLQVLAAHCAAVATTQQGCIILQRAMDVATGPMRVTLLNAVYEHLYGFSVDPFANYVVQHVLEIGDRESNSAAVVAAFAGHVVELSCNKFASNVVEKALFHLTQEAQHTLLMEMYSGGDEVLFRMLQDSFGNYIVQSSIALAPFRDVFLMSEKLRPVLQRTPYGHKIEARLDRRLKGKPVGTRSPVVGSGNRGTRKGQGQHQPASVTSSPLILPASSNASFMGDETPAEEPW